MQRKKNVHRPGLESGAFPIPAVHANQLRYRSTMLSIVKFISTFHFRYITYCEWYTKQDFDVFKLRKKC